MLLGISYTVKLLSFRTIIYVTPYQGTIAWEAAKLAAAARSNTFKRLTAKHSGVVFVSVQRACFYSHTGFRRGCIQVVSSELPGPVVRFILCEVFAS